MKDSTAIIIALIGIVVPATGAYLAFYDKRHPVGEAATPAQVIAARGTIPTDPQPNTAGDASSRSTIAADPEGRAETSAIRQIAGTWRSSDGYSFDFRQTGAQFRYRATQGDTDQGTGSGTIRGAALTYSFDSPDGPGACDATLSGDGNAIAGHCHAADAPAKIWPMRIDRVLK